MMLQASGLESEVRIIPEVGDVVVPDSWGTRVWSKLFSGDAYVDSAYQGCMFRLESSRYTDIQAPVNVTVTGHKPQRFNGCWPCYRCRIEFVGDGETSVYSSGWIYQPRFAR